MEINLKKIVYFCLNSNHNDNKKDKLFNSWEEKLLWWWNNILSNGNEEKKKYPYNGFEKIENVLLRKLYQKFL